MEIRHLTVTSEDSLESAMKILDRNALGVLFVIDNVGKLIGIATDGDIRRALLSGHDLKSQTGDIMNENFISLPADADNATIIKKLDNKIKIIPLVDQNNYLVDYATISRLRRIPIASPLLGGNELSYVSDCINTNWISSQGKYVQRFEELFSASHNGMSALAVSNGTVALHVALKALKIGGNDEVIVPNLTFAASINAVLYTGATPVLVDVDALTLNIDPQKIEDSITKKTKAIMPVHLYGQVCDMDSIMEIARKHSLLVIEDCAEALGSTYRNRPVGTFGDAATFSFFGNKTITTGEGGMVLFNDREVAKYAAVLRDHGMNKTKRYWHDEIGFNYRLTNIQAAIGVAQFERLQEFIDKKRFIASIYNETLSPYDFIQIPIEINETKNSYWLYTFLIKEHAPFTSQQLVSFLSNKGIETRPIFYPLHIMPPYQTFGNHASLSVSTKVSEMGLSLPSSVNLHEEEIRYICNTIESFINQRTVIG
ncbi:aminotransferase class I/II-fold pyridoxal phosphate-dependent enzyme [Parapedobacter sp. ISTM3]|uniref:aminotransferase class I/II-fold pyridoxal phosphate-dependent enzyme n=1 Tax=Parapedobacter sp. ISTM3 TaxID=2800130 RepID=UPI001908B46D|nr:aminotransferase class I/II-fold pyridoxal phosphate-dependent enzyme [Parapedobacter sp. ISTM3]MBK1438367.1 aminotransferase class I/II-fold pyridoxal phosphate-dependent enzyme [Parapedobacter sp. ISTM3]